MHLCLALFKAGGPLVVLLRSALLRWPSLTLLVLAALLFASASAVERLWLRPRDRRARLRAVALDPQERTSA